ncbi:unnamed protein product, partial [Bubo scandiacus]
MGPPPPRPRPEVGAGWGGGVGPRPAPHGPAGLERPGPGAAPRTAPRSRRQGAPAPPPGRWLCPAAPQGARRSPRSVRSPAPPSETTVRSAARLPPPRSPRCTARQSPAPSQCSHPPAAPARLPCKAPFSSLSSAALLGALPCPGSGGEKSCRAAAAAAAGGRWAALRSHREERRAAAPRRLLPGPPGLVVAAAPAGRPEGGRRVFGAWPAPSPSHPCSLGEASRDSPDGNLRPGVVCPGLFPAPPNGEAK